MPVHYLLQSLTIGALPGKSFKILPRAHITVAAYIFDKLEVDVSTDSRVSNSSSGIDSHVHAVYVVDRKKVDVPHEGRYNKRFEPNRSESGRFLREKRTGLGLCYVV
jgi:hypothetical protein